MKQKGRAHVTRESIVRMVSQSTGYVLSDCRKLVNGAFDAVIESLEKGESVSIPNLGLFRIKVCKRCKGVCPVTRQITEYPPRNRVTFTPSETMRAAVKKLPVE